MHCRVWTIFALLCVCRLAAPGNLSAQDGANVLIVTNTANSGSDAIADRYSKARSVPAENIVRLTTATTDDIDRAVFEREIELPISNWLARHNAQDQILYIVLTKGIPLRVRGSDGLNGTVASVDSELTLLYRKMLGVGVAPAGRVANPYFLADRAVTSAQPFSHRAADIYLVSRLDGFTQADVFQLIDHGASPVRDGQIVLDQRAKLLGDPGGDMWLAAAAKALGASGFGDRVILDSSGDVLRGKKPVLGYYSWGSNDSAIKIRRFDMGFVPGALAAMFVSTDARTFTEPPQSWTIGAWSDPASFYAGSPQSLAGDLIREGATGVAGHVAEPYLDATIRPQVLFPAYLAGFNLIESFYLAMPYLSWQTVVVGDPLCAPFRAQKLSSEDAAPGLDPDTELPKFFSARHATAMAAAGVTPQAIKFLLKADARSAHGDTPGTREALESATAVDARLNAAQLVLASLYEQAGEYDKAILRYRTVLATRPDDVLSLNNLAYALAVRKNAPKEALPLAQKAYQLSRGQANIADTLGWVYHLEGDEVQAEKYLAEALKAIPDNAELHLHLAAVYAATNRKAEAVTELNKAMSLNPALESQDEVKTLRSKLN